MTVESASPGPTSSGSPTNNVGNGDRISAAEIHQLETSNQQLKKRNLELEEETNKLKHDKETLNKNLQETNLLRSFTLSLGALVIVVATGLIVWTMELRAATLKDVTHKTGMLTQAEFIAGIAAGCMLILAVVVVLGLWRRTSYPTKSTL